MVNLSYILCLGFTTEILFARRAGFLSGGGGGGGGGGKRGGICPPPPPPPPPPLPLGYAETSILHVNLFKPL